MKPIPDFHMVEQAYWTSTKMVVKMRKLYHSKGGNKNFFRNTVLMHTSTLCAITFCNWKINRLLSNDLISSQCDIFTNSGFVFYWNPHHQTVEVFFLYQHRFSFFLISTRSCFLKRILKSAVTAVKTVLVTKFETAPSS